MDRLSLSINGKTINATLVKWQHLRFYIQDDVNLDEFEVYARRASSDVPSTMHVTTNTLRELNALGFVPVYFDIETTEQRGTQLSLALVHQDDYSSALSVIDRTYEPDGLSKFHAQLSDIDDSLVFNDEVSEYIVCITNDNCDKEWLRVATRLSLYAMEYDAVVKALGYTIDINPDKEEVSFTSLPQSKHLI